MPTKFSDFFGFGGGYKPTGVFEVKITGLKRTLVYLGKLQANLPKMNSELRNEFATDVMNRARVNVAVRSKYIGRDRVLQRHEVGTLEQSITVLQKATDKNKATAVVGIDSNSYAIRYAKAVELGRKGGTRIRAKRTTHSKLKFRNKAGNYIYPKEVKQGAAKGMFFMRDAVLVTSDIYRQKADKKSGDIIKNK